MDDLYLLLMFAYVEKWEIKERYLVVKNLILRKNYIYQLLGELYKELKSSEYYIEGNPITEPFYIYHE